MKAKLEIFKKEPNKTYASKILYYFLSILTSLNKKIENYKVVDLIESYNFYINFIFIQRGIKEL